LFETLEETQPWYVFCINPNDSQLPNQLEGRSVKGQVRSVGLPEITRRCAQAFPVGMTHREFVDRYREPLAALGISEGSNQERVEQARIAMGLSDHDVVLGQYKVCLLHPARWLRVLTSPAGFPFASGFPETRGPAPCPRCRGAEEEQDARC
jgi:chitin synthase